ncbi:hypothetical protein CIL03_18025 [Virgibacillus indicus]|uniref:Aspartate racemase n=1 Tax=Virgibacillus indicus TaxID=2024554 RepID=A0A265N584_9BACI|nr:aspartate/glutamate racemase family protein [Virgibacillus indicus]OZU87190.1 hypothetical protein CIL03_18025 [Virgibacillus indicus]
MFKKYDIEVLTPSITHQNEIDSIIFDELVLDVIKDKTKERMINIIKDYQCDGVILGCTELPLLISHNTSPLPVIDTAALHAEAALNFSLQN